MAVYFSPQLGNGGLGNLATAMELYDKFLGVGSQMRKQQLASGQQQIDIAGKSEQRAEQLQGPTLDSANAIAGVHKNELFNSNTDRATKEGSMAALDQAPVRLWKPTTDMTDQEMGEWTNLHTDNGVKDVSAAATAWNKAMGTMRGRFATPENGFATGFTTGPEGTMTTGAVMPDFSKMPSFAPPVSAPGTPPNGAPGAGAAPASGQAPATQAGGQLPDMRTLLPMMFNPATRAAVESAVQMQNALATNQEKTQQIEKNQREIAYGTPEERKAEGEFIRNAAQMSHRLDQMRATVEQHGNYGWTPEASALLKSLPLDMSDNWTKITNPGGVLREGLVHLNKEFQIPISPQTMFGGIPGVGPRNATTLAAIDQTKKVLADYVRQYENMATTKQPATGLTPELRKLVGPTKFGKPEEIPAETSANGGTGSQIYTSPAAALQSVQPGQPYLLTDPKTGKTVKWTRGKEPWATNQLPNVKPSAVVAPPQ